MDKIKQILQFIPGLFLMLVECIKAAESLLPIPEAGKAKLEVVRESMEKIFGSLKDIWPVLEGMVTVFVTAANAFGVFKKTSSEEVK